MALARRGNTTACDAVTQKKAAIGDFARVRRKNYALGRGRWAEGGIWCASYNLSILSTDILQSRTECASPSVRELLAYALAMLNMKPYGLSGGESGGLVRHATYRQWRGVTAGVMPLMPGAPAAAYGDDKTRRAAGRRWNSNSMQEAACAARRARQSTRVSSAYRNGNVTDRAHLPTC